MEQCPLQGTTDDSALQLISSWQPRFYNQHLTSTRPNLLQPQPSCLNNRLELLGCPFDAVLDAHHTDVPLVAVPREIAIIRRQWLRRRFEFFTSASAVHHLVAYQDTRVGGHGLSDRREDLDATFIGQAVSIKASASRRGREAFY